MMSNPKYESNAIILSPEAEEAGRLYRQAIALAETGAFDDAVAAAEAIGRVDFRLSQCFRSEALAFITAKRAAGGTGTQGSGRGRAGKL
jgi:hypothetical protein